MLQASGGTSRDIKCSNRLEELGSSCHSIYYTKMTNTTYIALKFIKEALKSSLNEDLTQKEEHMTKFFFLKTAHSYGICFKSSVSTIDIFKHLISGTVSIL